MPALRNEEEFSRARKSFIRATLLLGRYAPETLQETIRTIAGDGNALFEMIEYEAGDVAKAHAALEKKVEDLQESLKHLKDD